MKTDTIAAIATGMSNSGIGIVRISGDDALQVISRIYRNKKGEPKNLEPGEVTYDPLRLYL